jgi:hypothetical protein
MHRRTILTIIVALAMLAMAGTARASVGPANDNFADAPSLGASGNTTGNTVNSTLESGEVSVFSGDWLTEGDVWYLWTAPAGGGVVAFRTTNGGSNSQLNTYLTVETGSAITALTEVTTNDNYPGCCMSRIVFNAVSGTTYAIGVAPYPTGDGALNLFAGSFGLDWGSSTLYDQDTPSVGIVSATGGKNSMSISFVTQDSTASLVGPSWLTVECKRDNAPFSSCTSPWQTTPPGGKHTWQVRATDGAGNTNSASGTTRVKGPPNPH